MAYTIYNNVEEYNILSIQLISKTKKQQQDNCKIDPNRF